MNQTVDAGTESVAGLVFFTRMMEKALDSAGGRRMQRRI
jgi:hypothetical protein